MAKPKSSKTKRKYRILWGSEQPTRPTGYAVVTREICKRLVADGHEVFVMGWDHNGEDWTHEEGWTMVHAGIGGYGSDKINTGGVTVLEYNLQRLQPDIYISLIDPWFIGHAVMSTGKLNVPYVAYLPVDGYPLSYKWKDILANLDTPVWMSNFGREQMESFVQMYGSAGSSMPDMRDPILDRYLISPGEVIYHGVDLDVFKPLSDEDKAKARAALGIDWDFTFLSVARNTNRKQIPRLLEALKIAVDTLGDDKVGLILHCGDPTDAHNMGGWPLPDLIKEMGLYENVRFSDSSSNPLLGLTRPDMAMLYGLSDVHVLATGGEGFGIPSAEAMACGLPIILPANSTGPELVGKSNERGWLIPQDTEIVGPKWGVKMGLVSISKLADAMIEACLSRNTALYEEKSSSARTFAEAQFDWDKITQQFLNIIEKKVD
jgi:glycosyltransferase involved in cell wall biosynthesis